ncbi:MAG TPA: Gfo/Idh/MocA family oxidoreductase [Acetobacteraceae bacterium]|nr:Gfo/Idh/MocA family oxidoreductase [Acetobacteraceae bacterium]
MNTRRLRVGVAGAGHFGRYHALKLAKLARCELAGVHDRNPERAERVAGEAGTRALSLPDLLEACEAVVIAVPAASHHALGLAALRAGRPVLMEKPLAATLGEADELAALARARGLVLQVGHLERFSAAHGAILGRAGAPLYIEASRSGPFKPRGTDVSVVLDLMIHDLDLVLELTRSPLDAVEAVGAPVASARVDLANARLRFASGAVATISASRVAPRVERRMRIFGARGCVAVDFAARRLSVTARDQGEPLAALPGFGTETASWQEHDALEAEQAAFVAAVLDGAPIPVDAAAGRRALAAALRVEAAIEEAQERVRASGLLKEFEHGLGGGL